MLAQYNGCEGRERRGLERPRVDDVIRVTASSWTGSTTLVPVDARVERDVDVRFETGLDIGRVVAGGGPGRVPEQPAGPVDAAHGDEPEHERRQLRRLERGSAGRRDAGGVCGGGEDDDDDGRAGRNSADSDMLVSSVGVPEVRAATELCLTLAIARYYASQVLSHSHLWTGAVAVEPLHQQTNAVSHVEPILETSVPPPQSNGAFLLTLEENSYRGPGELTC